MHECVRKYEYRMGGRGGVRRDRDRNLMKYGELQSRYKDLHNIIATRDKNTKETRVYSIEKV